MDEFTGIAVWTLVIYLMLSTTVVWFSASDTFQGTGFAIPTYEPTSIIFGVDNIDEIKLIFFGVIIADCSTVTPFDLAFAPCFLSQALFIVEQWLGGIWTFATAWTRLIEVIFTGLPGASLFRDLLTFLFGAIQLTAIVVIIMRLAGIVRGGS